MTAQRMLDKHHPPTSAEMMAIIGSRSPLWADLRQCIEKDYDIPPEILFGGKEYGWLIHYRKGGRTLCDLYPEHGAFTVLVVLGKQETQQALAQLDTLSAAVRHSIENTTPLHDGLWLWLKPDVPDDIASIKTLLRLKRKPKPQTD
ncbi:MAG: DUF3788 domain-containing protein [Anaerolineae bacterium]